MLSQELRIYHHVVHCVSQSLQEVLELDCVSLAQRFFHEKVCLLFCQVISRQPDQGVDVLTLYFLPIVHLAMFELFLYKLGSLFPQSFVRGFSS